MQNMQSSYSDVVQQIKDRLDIVDVISRYVVLKKSANNWWGLCPFHGEKTPSFSVNREKQIFKCFGCNEGGDVFSFLMKINSQSFYEVLKEQAYNLNIDLPFGIEKRGDIQDKKEKILCALEKSSKFFTDNLLCSEYGQKALEYLNKRGIDENAIRKYSLGYSLNDYKSLQIRFEASEFETLEQAGLIIKRENNSGYIDRFRNRIMIPIFNENGNIVAFGARSIEANQNPKYLNSPDTLVYNKSNILYGLFHAKESIKENDSVILMEGYFDVISSQINGVENCVASCGTALTQEHVKLISKYTPSRKIYLSFDTDKAGKMATNRNSNVIKEVFAGLGDIKTYDENFAFAHNEKYVCEIRVITPAEGKDPDEFIRDHGAVEFRKHIKNAKLLLDYQLDLLLEDGKKENATAQEKARTIKKIIPFLLEIKNKIIQSEYIKLVARNLEIDEKSIFEQIKLQTSVDEDVYVPKKTRPIVKKNLNIEKKAQKILLSVYLMNINTLNLDEIKDMIKGIKFTDETLAKLKDTIDKMSCSDNNVSEIIEKLYTVYADDEEIKKEIVDLIYLADKYKDLADKDYKNVVKESVDKIKAFESKRVLQTLQEEFAKANDEEALRECQLKIQEHINKMKAGEK